MDWIHVVQGREYWQEIVNMVVNLLVPRNA